MLIDVVKDKDYSDKVHAMDIHGKYPYKIYLEVRGNSNIGKYIVIISSKQLNKDNEIDEISIKLKAKVANTNIIKPNTSTDGYYIHYKVKEVNILDVGDTPIMVYRSAKEN